MYPGFAAKDPQTVKTEAVEAHVEMFPQGEPEIAAQAFDWVLACFAGKCPDYQAVDTKYHDLEHTMQGTLCLVRLLRGRHLIAAQPVLTEEAFHLGLLAILMHDTGYLKHRGDNQGTGAKYTATHVERSAQFAASLLTRKGLAARQIQAIHNMIHCTGVNTNLEAIPFQSELERVVGFAMGTADLVGQMAAEDYIDKLPVLYSEFEEATHFSPGSAGYIANFSSADDLMRKTPAFWRKMVLPKLEGSFLGLYRYLSVPYPDGPNVYVEAIEANLRKLQARLG